MSTTVYRRWLLGNETATYPDVNALWKTLDPGASKPLAIEYMDTLVQIKLRFSVLGNHITTLTFRQRIPPYRNQCNQEFGSSPLASRGSSMVILRG